jgi:hypothetical protein
MQVEQLLSQLEALGRNEPWVAASIAFTEAAMRERDEQRMSKEMLYKSRKMQAASQALMRLCSAWPLTTKRLHSCDANQPKDVGPSAKNSSEAKRQYSEERMSKDESHRQRNCSAACSKLFKIDESGYADILKQVHDHEFESS